MEPNKHSQVIFKVIAILLPFVAVVFLELCLTIFNYGYNANLFIKDKSQPGNIEVNTEISRLFFNNRRDARTGINQSFKKEKPNGTFRIFVLGESSSYGYPFTPRVSFARMLQDRLLHTFTNKNIEVINLSVTALNSYAFLTFSKELVNYQPDAVIIYAGHNEYYGAMGAASRHTGSGRAVKKAIICLKRFKTVQLVFNTAENVHSWFEKDKPGKMIYEKADNNNRKKIH